jgi:photosystem II stability/assembly factor-like uncharacterized protein
MHSITFSDSLNGWMVGERYGNGNLRIFHTSDGGQNWQPQDSSMAGGDLFGVVFADSLNGWASAGQPLHTTDGGNNWSYQTAPGSGVGVISAISPTTAWGISSIDNQFVKFTYDSGKTWQQMQFTNDDLFGPKGGMFSDSLYGWIVGNTVIGGQFAMTIYHTTDGGNVWVEEARNLYGRGLNAVYAVDSQHVWAVGSDGSVVNYGYVTTRVKDTSGALLPRQYTLYQNYPNPFNPTTNISFSLPVPGKVVLTIYNILGQKVRTLADGDKPAGTHTLIWDGTDSRGAPVSSGVYFYKIESANFREVKRMVFVK